MLDSLYNTDLGVVKEYRAIYLPEGINKVLFEGVASRIDPTSVRLKAVDSVIDVMDQNLQYDLVSKDKILTKYIDKDIVAYLTYGNKKELIEGTLLSYSGDQLIIKDKYGMIQILDSNNRGIPLPKGTVCVFTNDKEGKLQFIGTDSIDHTPKDETISLYYFYPFFQIIFVKIIDDRRSECEMSFGRDKCGYRRDEMPNRDAIEAELYMLITGITTYQIAITAYQVDRTDIMRSPTAFRSISLDSADKAVNKFL